MEHQQEKWVLLVASTAKQDLGGAAALWLSAPNAELGGVAPQTLAVDPMGARMVLEALRRRAGAAAVV